MKRRLPLPECLEPASCDLPALLKRLSLPTIRRLLDDTERIAVDHQMGHREFLAHLVVAEVLNRDQTRMQRMTRHAHFPFLAPVETLLFAPKGNLRRDLIAPFLALDYVASGKHLILSGKTGRGKTALAIAIAIKAIQHGADARFITAADLIDHLTGPAHRGELSTAVEPFIAAKVLIIDEIGYLPHAADAANVLYTIVEARHRLKRPMILTTNKPLKNWGSVLHDADLAEAILDRLLQDGRHIDIIGRSWRTGRTDDHATVETAVAAAGVPAHDAHPVGEPRDGWVQGGARERPSLLRSWGQDHLQGPSGPILFLPAAPARIFGIARPEFPEATQPNCVAGPPLQRHDRPSELSGHS